jgi:RNA polymerase sigma-70 factor (ECF subfamily)
MFVVCLRYAANREEAEDIMQEGFIKVFKNLHQFKFKGSFEGWIRKIIVNTALEKFRSGQKLYLISTDQNLPPDIFFIEDAFQKLYVKELIKAIQLLPPMCRIVFNLYVFEGMKHMEIAQLLNISDGTSKSHLHDARTILQKQINKNSIKINSQ